MPNPHGSFIWYELITPDPAASKAFYDDVVGWTIDAEAPPGGMDYRMIEAPDGENAGGVMRLSDDMASGDVRPGWLGYLGVDDVDQAVESVTREGGKVQMPPTDIPDVGRIAMVADPQGVPIYVMRGASDENSTAYGRMAMGHVSWNELATPDPEAAIAFYGKTFGYRKEGAMPMGDLGDYTFLAHAGSDEVIGAVWKNPQEMPPMWSFYFRVPDIYAAKAKIEAGGGRVFQDPMEVPGGEMTLNASDPHGVVFGLVAPGKPQGE